MKAHRISSICNSLMVNGPKIEGMINGTVGDVNDFLYKATWRDEQNILTGFQKQLAVKSYTGKGGKLNNHLSTAKKMGTQAAALGKITGCKTSTEFGEFLYHVGYADAARAAGYVPSSGLEAKAPAVVETKAPAATASNAASDAIGRAINAPLHESGRRFA